MNLDLEELKRELEEIGPPWRLHQYLPGAFWRVLNKHGYSVTEGYAPTIIFIGKAPKRIAALVAEVERLQEDSRLLSKLIAILSNHCGERGRSEDAVETLERITQERNILQKRVLQLV